MNRTVLRVSLKIIASTALGLILCQFPFHSIESLTYDARFRLQPPPQTSGKVVLVAVDQKTLANLKRNPNLVDLGLTIRAVSADQPEAIIVLSPLQQDKRPIAEQAFLAKVASEIPNLTIGLNDIFLKGEEDKLLLAPPLQNLKTGMAPTSTDESNFAADRVSRRTLVSVEGALLLPTLLAQKFTPISAPEGYRGAFEFKGSTQILTNFRPKGSYQAKSLVDVIEQRFPKDSFKGKIVLIGSANESETDDYVKTPLNRDVLAMSKLELMANSIDTLILNDGIVRPPDWLNLLITTLVCLLTLYFVFSWRPLKGLLGLVVMAASYVIIAWGIFAFAGVSITMTHPLLAIFISYYFFIPYRLIQESRRSWEYQQKNKLLTEVEQLKTNFLSMMSHDLKTPLARIQGMADVALSHPESLSPEQQQALKSIGQSTDELTTFISSILDLGRVESQEVKLQLQPKDINALLGEVIGKYEYMAKSKNITIVREFEPLFSAKVDVTLMKQVFSNLIENAIKYSPEGSKILVSTEEVDGRIQIQVADQGLGIPTDEVDNVFMKFYRSSGVKNSPIKGSGLGLFLAKYFVELHKGHISVESVPTQGSTFTVDLPMQ